MHLYQNHDLDLEPVILKSCVTIEKFEAQMSEAVIYADFKNVIYLFLTTSGCSLRATSIFAQLAML